MKSKFCLMVMLLTLFNNGFAQNDFFVISSRIKEQICREANEQAVLKSVVAFLPVLQSNGSWGDIDYNNKEITKWKPAAHLDRVKAFTLAYISDGSFYYNNKAVCDAIVNALRFWYAQNPKSNNWWHNEIATPQSLGEILILLQYSNMQLPAGLQDSLVQRMKQGNVFEKTGANKLDIALHIIYRACITKDKALMDTAVQQAFQPVSFTNDEGIQYDFSYLQHGPQLQISSYGLVFLTGEYKVASWVQGTSYALRGEQLRLLNHYFLNSFLPAIRGRYIDFNTEGRGISRKDILDKKGLAVNGKSNSLLEMAKKVSPENAAAINAAIERISEQQSPGFSIKPVHNFFWKADYTQHLRPAYTFNVRMVSDRTKRTEAGNKENLIGKYLPDGSANIQRNGSEYFNIMPVWEWDKIPGITSRDFEQDRPMLVQWGENGSTAFVGGVSDSLYGVSCYDMNYDSVKAKKAWFFFDKEVVCLGAGINSNASENIVTTINQCWLSGKAKLFADGKTYTIKKDQKAANADWVWHDSTGYFFHQPANVYVTAQKQKGSWSRINASQPKEQVEVDVFKLWINHKSNPVDSSYAYSVVPGISAAEMEKTYAAGDVKILSNSSKVQAVYHSGLDILQVVFYEAGKVEVNGFVLTADKACTILIKELKKTKPVLWMADPSQKQKQIVIKIKNTEADKLWEVVCELPQGNYAGSSKKVNAFAK